MAYGTGNRIYSAGFLIAACLLIGVLAVRILLPFVAAIAWAAILAVVFHAPWTFLERRMSRRRNLAAALMSLVIALVVLLPAALFAGLLTSQALDAAGRVSEALQSQHVTSLSDVVALPGVADFLGRAESQFGVSREDIGKLAAGFTSRVSAVLGAFSKRLLLGVFDGVLTFLTTIFLLFFFLRDGAEMRRELIELVPTDAEGRQALQGSLSKMIATIFRGSLLAAVAQGLSGGIGWWLAGLGSPALAGAAMSILSLLPIGGTAIVWIPGCLWLWVAGSTGSAAFLFLWGLVVTSFLADNFLKPMLIGGTDELSTMMVFLGVFGGLTAFGLVGIFVGPVTLVLAKALVDLLRHQSGPRSPAPLPPRAGTETTAA
jgi:predicted PurR-regulated permease PerM